MSEWLKLAGLLAWLCGPSSSGHCGKSFRVDLVRNARIEDTPREPFISAPIKAQMAFKDAL